MLSSSDYVDGRPVYLTMLVQSLIEQKVWKLHEVIGLAGFHLRHEFATVAVQATAFPSSYFYTPSVHHSYPSP
jgi:hypothetical protein